MHELSIAQALIDQVDAIVRERDAVRVNRINIEVGALSGVDARALQAVFPFATADTCADGAELAITEVPSRVRCRDCAEETSPTFPMILCESCESTNVELIAGQELMLTTIDIDETENATDEANHV